MRSLRIIKELIKERFGAKPLWRKDKEEEETKDSLMLREHKQLRLMSVYGIGGCSVVKLTDEEMDSWFDFATGKGKATIGIHALLARAIPKAYDAVMTRKLDCREYFFGEHNARVKATKVTGSRIRLCLAREGSVESVLDRTLAAQMLMTNTALLKSKTGKRLSRVGIIDTNEGAEYAFLEFIPGVSIGDAVIIHRNIACEIVRERREV